MAHVLAETSCLLAGQAAALCRLARLANWATTTLAADGRCATPLGRLWDDWAATLAAALLAALHGAQLLAAEPPGGVEGGNGGSETNGSSKRQQQQQQQQPWERRDMGEVAYDLAAAARLLLPPAGAAGLPTLQREPVPRLLSSLGKYCSIESARLFRFVKVLIT